MWQRSAISVAIPWSKSAPDAEQSPARWQPGRRTWLQLNMTASWPRGCALNFLPSESTVVQQDVLEFDFAAAAAQAGAKLRVAGNLPYYITSPILRKLAANHSSLGTAVLMVQREVGDRVTASPGSRDYGLLSVLVQANGPVEQLFTLPPSAFSPPPKVHSTVFRWRFAPRFKELGVEETSFLRLVAQAFAQKRKTLANNLRAAEVAQAVVHDALARAEIDPMARAESLSIELFAALWRALGTSAPSTKGEPS